jgi:NAD-dependent SIR2 family protein deacetylase
MGTSADLAAFLRTHARIFVLTGAGCSTASGIPDYRDEQGAWKRQQPITLQELLRSEHKRKRYWARSLLGWRTMGEALPNAAHYALAQLEQSGRVALLVTQNVDGLHRRAGSRDVLDLHGTLDEVECLACGVVSSREEHQLRLAALNPEFLQLRGALAPDGDMDLLGADYDSFHVPGCSSCGGLLKPRVVFFGESVPKQRVDQAYAALECSDALLVVGSSLMLFSGYRFAHRAAQRGTPIAILNRGRTRADSLASLKIEEEIGAALEIAVGFEEPPGGPWCADRDWIPPSTAG